MTSSIHRQALRLACPAIVTNITTPLLGLVDTALVGHLGSAVYLAAIAVGSTMFNMIYWLLGFLRMGTSGMAAQACGAGDSSAAVTVLMRGLMTGLAVGVIIAAAAVPLSWLGMAMIGPDKAAGELASRYFMIAVWGAPAVLANYAMTGWLLGMQDSRAGMWIAIATNVSNILISAILVLACGMKIAGVAIGTLSAQWVGAAVASWYCHRHGIGRRDLRQAFRGAAELWRGSGKYVKINGFIFLRTLCLVGVTVWFTRAGAAQGTVVLGANALLMQLFMLFSFFMDGFAYAGEAMAGRCIGAADYAGLRATVRVLIIWGMALSLVTAGLYYAGGEYLLCILSSEEHVTGTAAEYLGWAVTVPLVGFLAFVWDGIYIGATATARMAVSVGVAAAVYLALTLLLTPVMGNHGLWLAFCAYLLSRGLLQTLMARPLLRPTPPR